MNNREFTNITDKVLDEALDRFFEIIEVEGTLRLSINYQTIRSIEFLRSKPIKAAAYYILANMIDSIYVRPGDSFLNYPFGWWNRLQRFYRATQIELAIDYFYPEKFKLKNRDDHLLMYSGDGIGVPDMIDLDNNLGVEVKMGEYLSTVQNLHGAQEIVYVIYQKMNFTGQGNVYKNHKIYFVTRNSGPLSLTKEYDINFYEKFLEFTNKCFPDLPNYWQTFGPEKIDYKDYIFLKDYRVYQEEAESVIHEMINRKLYLKKKNSSLLIN